MTEIKSEKVVVQSLDDIPQGMSEAEEHAYWKTHEMGEGIKFYPVPEDDPDLPAPRNDEPSEEVTIAFTSNELRRVKALARRQNKNYLRFIKEAVLERLKEKEATR
jgi:hypothetical protein